MIVFQTKVRILQPYHDTHTSPHILPASFLIFMALRDAFGGFRGAAVFGAKKKSSSSVVVAVMIRPSLIESSMLFF